MTENNKKQAMLPEDSVVFENDWGTAPGCAVEQSGKTVIMLPGPPREMRPMFEACVRPYLSKYSDGVIASVALREFGMPESTVQALLGDLMEGSSPTLSPYAKEGEVLLRATARAADEKTALEIIRPVAQEVKKRLGSFFYGENVENLQQVVVDTLRKQGKKIALAESCTGGYVAKRITEVSGSSEIFECGVVSYANSVKHRLLGVRNETLEAYGAVSPQTALEMAEGVRVLGGAQIGVGITGIAGPGGGTAEKPVGLVYASVSDGVRCYVRRMILGHSTGDEREHIRYLASSNALDMVRRLITGLEPAEGTDCVELPAKN